MGDMGQLLVVAISFNYQKDGCVTSRPPSPPTKGWHSRQKTGTLGQCLELKEALGICSASVVWVSHGECSGIWSVILESRRFRGWVK